MKRQYRYLILCTVLIVKVIIVGPAQPDWLSTERGFKKNIASEDSIYIAEKKQKKKEKQKEKHEKKCSPLDNLLKWACHFLSERYEYEKECSREHLYTPRNGKNGSLFIPLLEGPMILAAAKRPFCLSWQGGKSPYRIRLYHQYERRPFIEREPVKENSLRIDNLALSPGNYNLKIDDAKGRNIKAKFTVVDPNELPRMPHQEELRQSDLAEAAKITLYATWLAAQNDGKWIFECYQRVAEIADKYHPACLLCNALADGQRPVLGQVGDSEPSTHIEW